MAEFSLNVIGSAAVASLVAAGVIAFEQLHLLAGISNERRKRSRDKDNGSPEA